MLKHIITIISITMTGLMAIPMYASTSLSGTTATAPLSQKLTTKTVTLFIPDMTCPVCPITIKKALEGVVGVNYVSVDFNAKTATVTFDPKRTTTNALTTVTQKVGYVAKAIG